MRSIMRLCFYSMMLVVISAACKKRTDDSDSDDDKVNDEASQADMDLPENILDKSLDDTIVTLAALAAKFPAVKNSEPYKESLEISSKETAQANLRGDKEAVFIDRLTKLRRLEESLDNLELANLPAAALKDIQQLKKATTEALDKIDDILTTQ